MSKYYKAEDVLSIFSEEERPFNWSDTEAEIQEGIDFDYYKGVIESLPTIEANIDCISREWLLKLLKTVVFKFDDGTVANGIDVTRLIYPPLYKMIKDAPSVMPKRSCYRCGLREECEDSTERKPKQGEWIPNHDGTWNCSNCGLRVLIYAKGNYCPNCGAKMKGDE